MYSFVSRKPQIEVASFTRDKRIEERATIFRALFTRDMPRRLGLGSDLRAGGWVCGREDVTPLRV